jgi:hypothetical protein
VQKSEKQPVSEAKMNTKNGSISVSKKEQSLYLSKGFLGNAV